MAKSLTDRRLPEPVQFTLGPDIEGGSLSRATESASVGNFTEEGVGRAAARIDFSIDVANERRPVV